MISDHNARKADNRDDKKHPAKFEMLPCYPPFLV